MESATSGTEFKREINTFQLTLICVGAIIGAGVFSLTGVGISYAGPAAFLVYIVAALIGIVSTIPTMIAASACPTTGGYYKYISRFLDPTLAFYYMWNRIIGIFSVSVVAMSFGQYVQVIFPKVPVEVSALGAILLFTVLNLFDVKLITKANKYFVYVLIAALVWFLVEGLPKADVTRLQGFFEKGFGNFVTALIMYMFALDGASVVINMGGEVKDPRKSIPMAIIWGTLIAGVLYALLAFAATTAVDFRQLIPPVSKRAQPLGAFAKTFMSPAGFVFFISGGAFLAILTTLNAGIMIQSRIFWAAARDGIFPKWFATLNKHRQPARVSVVVAVVISLPILLKFSLGFTTLITLVPGFLFSMMMPISVLFIEKKFPNLYRKSLMPLPKLWLYLIVAFSLGVSLLLSWNGLLKIGLKNLYYFAGFFGLGTVYYFFMVARMRKQGRNYRDIKKDYDKYWIEEEARLAALAAK
ncbi:MAG TPA: APC family permease [Spirochaetales bacterium]|nr:APC family permease [Spirochaetales bacterium]